MKCLPLRELETVASALNFTTSDCRVVGSCDLYTIKATGKEKKLYKSIDSSLNSQHDSLVKLAASFYSSMSSPNSQTLSLNLTRASPFGPLSQPSNRRTFAYLIACLNASHPDYDFSYILRPSDFRKERNLKAVLAKVDETLYNLRPKGSQYESANGISTPQTPGGGTIWCPRMWTIIDREMTLMECEIYRYCPEEDPFDAEEAAIWTMNYLIFNKVRRRVLYIFVRGFSSLSGHSPNMRGVSFSKTGASKRARYWLGEKADRCMSEPVWGEDDDGDEDDYVIDDPDDDEVDAEDMPGQSQLSIHGWSDEDEEAEEIQRRWREKHGPRGVSESIMEDLEV